MATQFSMLGIMNAALLSQGQFEVASENDGTLEFRTMARNWAAVVEAELEDGAYNFTKVEAELVTRVPGGFEFTDGYVVPSSALHVRNVWILGANGTKIEVDWVQDGTNVYLNNATGCWIEYAVCPEPDLWSANFVRGVQKRMEAIISRAVGEEFAEADGLDQAAEMYFQRARTNSSKSRSAKPLYRKGPIALARNRRG